MIDGYAIGLDGTRFSIKTGLIYCSVFAHRDEWVSTIEHSGYDNVSIVIPHLGNMAFINTIYLEGSELSPIRLKSLALPSSVREVVMNQHVYIEDGFTLPYDISYIELDGRLSINNLTDFIDDDSVNIALFTNT